MCQFNSGLCIVFLGLYVCLYACTTYFNDCRYFKYFVISSVWCFQVLFFLKIALAIWGALWFHMKLWEKEVKLNFVFPIKPNNFYGLAFLVHVLIRWSISVIYISSYVWDYFLDLLTCAIVALVVKNPPANAEDWEMGLIPGSGRSPGAGLATHSSILARRISMDRGPSRTQLKQLSMHTHYYQMLIWSSLCQNHSPNYYTLLLLTSMLHLSPLL